MLLRPCSQLCGSAHACRAAVLSAAPALQSLVSRSGAHCWHRYSGIVFECSLTLNVYTGSVARGHASGQSACTACRMAVWFERGAEHSCSLVVYAVLRSKLQPRQFDRAYEYWNAESWNLVFVVRIMRVHSSCSHLEAVHDTTSMCFHRWASKRSQCL